MLVKICDGANSLLAATAAAAAGYHKFLRRRQAVVPPVILGECRSMQDGQITWLECTI